jgi:sigma-E factor negative regulatory protein RseA
MNMSIESSEPSPRAEPLSALVDGELSDAEVASLCASWREDGTLRRRWHAYQLIGDVLRSDDLASDPARDAAFVSSLRSRLAKEPVVLAPASIRGAGLSRRRWGWRAPSAVAAGFVAVAGTVIVLQRPVQAPEPLATVSPPAAGQAAMPVVAAASAPAVAAEKAPAVSNLTIIRDAQLDRYLFAHKQYTGSSALAPSGYLQANTVERAPR